MMFGKKIADKEVSRIAVFFMMFVAALFVISIASSASAYPFALQGKVISVDSDGKKLVLQEERCGMNGGQFGFTWDRQSTVMIGDNFAAFSDIRPGDDIIVTYYESSPGLYVAEDINIPDMLREHC